AHFVAAEVRQTVLADLVDELFEPSPHLRPRVDELLEHLIRSSLTMTIVSTTLLPAMPVPTSPYATTDELVIETPERVELYYTRAQVGNRFLAAGVDHLIQLFMMGSIALVAYLFSGEMEKVWQELGNWAI